MPFASVLGMQAAGALLGGAAGAIFGKGQDRRARKQQEKMNIINQKAHEIQTEYNMGKQLEMWEKTGYGAQVDQIKRAGLNPAMIYGMGGAGGQTTDVATGHTQGGPQVQTGGEAQQFAGMGLMLQQQAAQTELIKAQTENVEAQTEKTKGVDTTEAKGRIALMNLERDWLGKTFDARMEELDRRIEKTTQESREIDQRIGITADTRQATVDKAQQEAIGATLQNILIGENTKATTQQIEESKARVNQMSEQIKNWQQQIKQGWEELSLKEKQIKLDALMKEVETVTQKKSIADVPALTPNQRRQVIRQIDKIARIGETDYK